MKKNIWIILTILAGISLLYFFFTVWADRTQTDTHAAEPAQALANDDSVRSHKAQYLFIIDSLNKDKRQLIEENERLKAGQEQAKGEVNKWASKAKDLAAQIKVMNKDTALNSKVDSLVNLVDNLNFFLVQYEVYTDSLNRVNAALQANYEAKDTEKDKRITELQTAYDSLFKAYQQLFADSRVMAKDLKRQKLKTKVVGVLGAAAAVLGLIK
jgi:hypothetical protein